MWLVTTSIATETWKVVEITMSGINKNHRKLVPRYLYSSPKETHHRNKLFHEQHNGKHGHCKFLNKKIGEHTHCANT